MKIILVSFGILLFVTPSLWAVCQTPNADRNGNVVLTKGATFIPEHLENLYNKRAGSKVPTPVDAVVKGDFHQGAGDQIMFACDNSGKKEANGPRICIQMLSSIFTGGTATDSDILHGAVLILDRENGELLDTKKLYVGDPVQKPLDAVNYIGDRQNLMKALCYNRTLSYNENREEKSRSYCLCAPPSSRKNSICGKSTGAVFELSQVDSDPGIHGYLANAAFDTYYRPMNLNLKKRLLDASNGVYPINKCDTQKRRKQRESYYGRFTQSNISRDSEALRDCDKQLSSQSVKLAATISTFYNEAYKQGNGGTFSRVISLVASARRILKCEPVNAAQRADYGGSPVRHRTESAGVAQ